MIMQLVAKGVFALWFVVLLALPAAADTDKQDTQSKPAKRPPLRLMSAEKDARLRTYLPKVSDPEVAEILGDPNLILYTDTEMPPAHQDWAGMLNGIHSRTYNISADNSEPHGNGNVEFPWGTPAGTHRTKNVFAFRFLRLPEDNDGNQLPVVWHHRVLRGDSQAGYAWTFPVGTVFGEVLTMRAPSSKYYTFEMRMRVREEGDWGVDVFRPFPTADALAYRIRELRPNWNESERLVALVRHLDTPVDLPRLRLVSRQPRRQPFHQQMGVDKLPAIGDDKLVAELLTTTTFKSAHGQIWRQIAGDEASFAPTTDARFHIVPARFDAGFIAVDRQSCMRCHETVNQSVRNFNPGRDWYGRIRGSDGIFSFHPFALGSISYNGYGRGVAMRPALVNAGLLERYDRDKHPAKIYNKVPHLVE